MPPVVPFENFYDDWNGENITVIFFFVIPSVFLQSVVPIIQDFCAKLSQCHITVTSFDQVCLLDQMQYPGIFRAQSLWSGYYS